MLTHRISWFNIYKNKNTIASETEPTENQVTEDSEAQRTQKVRGNFTCSSLLDQTFQQIRSFLFIINHVFLSSKRKMSNHGSITGFVEQNLLSSLITCSVLLFALVLFIFCMQTACWRGSQFLNLILTDILIPGTLCDCFFTPFPSWGKAGTG